MYDNSAVNVNNILRCIVSAKGNFIKFEFIITVLYYLLHSAVICSCCYAACGIDFDRHQIHKNRKKNYIRMYRKYVLSTPRESSRVIRLLGNCETHSTTILKQRNSVIQLEWRGNFKFLKNFHLNSSVGLSEKSLIKAQELIRWAGHLSAALLSFKISSRHQCNEKWEIYLRSW